MVVGSKGRLTGAKGEKANFLYGLESFVIRGPKTKKKGRSTKRAIPQLSY
jgi:hypothetical protein